MFGLSPAHLLIIMVIALIVVGPGKLPEVGAAIGKSVREFQKASGGITDTLTGVVSSATQPTQPTQAPQPTAPVPPAQSYYAAQPAYPAPAYPAPVSQAPAYPVMQAPSQPAPVPYPVMGVVEPAPPAIAQPIPTGDPQQDAIVQQSPLPPRVD
jgi:TatA/E family protein of Tat protein translocase